MDNPQLALARRYIEQTDTSLFLTGKAGTGKTTFLHEVADHCAKSHVVVAPTGVAAVNAKGVTIHSFFQLPFEPYLPEVKELITEYQMTNRMGRMNRMKRNIMQSMELLIIDEISMVRADVLDAIDMTLRTVRHSSRPFGGVQLLMIGDVYQLAPVVKEEERQYMQQVYASPYFFHSKALQKLLYVTIELDVVYRQQDQQFVQLLNKVRLGIIDADTLRVLNSRVGSPEPNVITLTTHNYQAQAINDSKMRELTGEERESQAVVTGNFPSHMFPVDEKMTLKEGERVMFTRNDPSQMHAYYNGKLGTVVGFDDETKPFKVMIAADEGEVLTVGMEQWENYKYTLNPRSGQVEREVEGSFRQYPLRPAWAVTIHKAQGLTFDRVSINAAEAFAFGQVYVALSRCRTLEGLTLLTRVGKDVVFSDADVQTFCDAQPTYAQVLEAVETAEEAYYYDQLFSLFDMTDLCDAIERMVRAYKPLQQLYAKRYQALTEAQVAMVKLDDVSSRFRSQLQHLPRAEHAPRIAKGAAYYKAQLSALEQNTARVGEVEVDNKEGAAQLKSAVAEWQQGVGRKLACLQCVEEHGFDVRRLHQAKVNYELHTDDSSEASTRRKKGEGGKPTARQQEKDSIMEELVEYLSEWRRERAAADGVPAFRVMHQKTLIAVASALPKDKNELMQIPGIGRHKADEYGDELIERIRSFAEMLESEAEMREAWA